MLILARWEVYDGWPGGRRLLFPSRSESVPPPLAPFRGEERAGSALRPLPKLEPPPGVVGYFDFMKMAHRSTFSIQIINEYMQGTLLGGLPLLYSNEHRQQEGGGEEGRAGCVPPNSRISRGRPLKTFCNSIQVYRLLSTLLA